MDNVIREETQVKNTGAAQTFEEIWKAYYSKLLVYLTHSFSLSEAEAQDLVQDSLIKAYKHLHRYSKKYALSTWLYRIARNGSIDYLRREGRREGRRQKIGDLQETVDGPGPSPSPEELFEARATEERIAAFLKKLPPRDRELAYLRTYEEMGFKEIGRTLGIPTGTARYRMHEIKKKLKREMEKWYE